MKTDNKDKFPFGAILTASFIAMLVSFNLSPFLLAVSIIVFLLVSVAFANHLANQLPDDGWGPFGGI
jgi:hypothetical protein